MTNNPTKSAGGGSPGISLPRLPDHLHVVFCRILDMGTLPTDRLAAAMQALHDTPGGHGRAQAQHPYGDSPATLAQRGRSLPGHARSAL